MSVQCVVLEAVGVVGCDAAADIAAHSASNGAVHWWCCAGVKQVWVLLTVLRLSAVLVLGVWCSPVLHPAVDTLLVLYCPAGNHEEKRRKKRCLWQFEAHNTSTDTVLHRHRA